MDHVSGCSCPYCVVGSSGVAAQQMPPLVGEGSLTELQQAELRCVRELAPMTAQQARDLGMHALGDGRMCYHSIDSADHHLAVYAYSVDRGRVCLTAHHGADSTMPGVGRMATDPHWLVPCGCGRWQEPTAAQTDVTRQRIAGERAKDIARAQRRSLTKRKKH